MRQLQLDIEPHFDAHISDFSGPSWEPIIDGVRQLHTGDINRLYLYGGAGTGKTHLLSAICDTYRDIDRTAIQISVLELITHSPELLTSLEHFQLIAFDDIEAIIGLREWQIAVFNLINNVHTVGGQLVFSSRFAPLELQFELPDLRSRLTQAVSIKLPTGELYADRHALIYTTLERESLILPEEILNYLLLNGPQQTSLLLECLYRLKQLLKGEKLNLSKTILKQIYALIDEYQIYRLPH